MKKFISALLSILMIFTLCISVSAADEDGYAYGSYEIGENEIFQSEICIYSIENAEKVIITVTYNPAKLSEPTFKAPAYFNVTEAKTSDKIVLTVTEGAGYYEKEYFYVNFQVLDLQLRREDTGFSVSARAEFSDGSTKELKIANNVDIILHMPVVFWKTELRMTADKKFFIAGETITFTIPVHYVSEAEKVAVDFHYKKDVLSFKEICVTESVIYTAEETENGYSVIYDCSETSDGSIGITFDVKEKQVPEFSVGAKKITENGGEEFLNFESNVPYNYVHNAEDIGYIVLSDRFELYRVDDILYLPFTVQEKDFEGEISPSVAGCSADLVYRFASSGYTDRPVATGEEIVAYTGGTISDRIKICVAGDVNCNGEVTAADARLVLRYAAQLEKFDGLRENAADTDHDEKITAADARKILRVAASIDKFDNPEKTVRVGEEFVVDKLKNAGSGAYNWNCTVSDESAFEITDTIAPPEGVEIKPGTPYEQTFTFKALKTGVYSVHFELIASWEEEPIDSFDFTVVVHPDEPFYDDK